MDRLKLRVRVCLSLEIHLAEHIEGRFVPHTASSGSRLALNSTCQLPPALITAEAEWLAILAMGQHDTLRTTTMIIRNSHDRRQ
jgi:hypothetical protein